MGRYVGNEPDSLYALNEIQKVAALMRFELERGKIDEFANLLNYHWELKNGDKILKAADKYKKLSSKYKDWKNKYNTWKKSGKGTDLEKAEAACDQFKEILEELNLAISSM